MGLIKSFNEYFTLTESKKSKEIIKNNIKVAQNLNKKYNIETFPKSSKSKDKYYSHTNTNIINIGDPEPVKKFKEWNSKYWLHNK